jgi:TonB family protein
VRAAGREQILMTVSIKNPSELNSAANPGAPTQNSENKPGQTPRSNPVCLEVNVTLRSLPSEPGGLTQPIREEARTVIVFDNGAVIRSTSNLPVGQTVILSNSNGRDVVCRVAGGRNLPSVKGYVEVEFIEPVKDFWSIHQAAEPLLPAVSPIVTVAAQNPPSPPLPAPVVAPAVAAPPAPAAKQTSASLGRGPSFDDLAGVIGVSPRSEPSESKATMEKSAPEKKSKGGSDYELSQPTAQTSVANWRPAAMETSADKHSAQPNLEPLSITSPAPAASRDFMTKGLMAYEQPDSISQSSALRGRTPLIVGAAAAAVAAVLAIVFFVHRGSAPAPGSTAAAVSQSSAAETLASPANTAPAQAAPAESQAPTSSSTQEQPQPQTAALEQSRSAAAPAAVPAVVTGPANADSRGGARLEARAETGSLRGQEKNAVMSQPETSSSRRPAIPNLKLSTPSAPNKNNLANNLPNNLNDAPEPMAAIAAAGPAGAAPPGLLTSAGRISKAPVAPPSAPAPAVAAPVAVPKTLTAPKLLTSTRPLYPSSARQSNIQGVVAVLLNIDANGKVVGAKALSGPLLLQQSAIEAVQQWKYSPGLTDGKPTPAQVTVSLDFRLN